MSSNETFTADEIMDAFTDYGIDVVFTEADGKEIFFPSLNCVLGELDFYCILIYQEPFFQGVKMYADRCDVENPVLFTNHYNQEIRSSRAFCEFGSDGLIQFDSDGDANVRLQMDMYFAGGVTWDHLKFMFGMWLEDVFDFYEITVEDVMVQLENNETEVAISEDAPLLDKVVACLSGSEAMTSRQIARLLDCDRHMVNSILYKERNRFANDGAQPPRWSLA